MINHFVPQNEIYLKLLNIWIPISKAISKGIFLILNLESQQHQQPSEDTHILFSEHSLEWREIYSLPFKVALDTNSRAFQYKILHRYLATNTLLKKIGKVDSSACSFCGTVDESLEHHFVSCAIITTFWSDLICWCRSINIKIDSLGALDILLGLWKRKDDFLLLNHIIAKQYIYYCRNNLLKPSFTVLLSKIDSLHNNENRISSLNKKLVTHSSKWDKYIKSSG